MPRVALPRWFALCFPLWLPLIASAQCPGVTTQQIGFATEKLTISNVATPLTSLVYKPSGITPTMAEVSVEGGTIRYNVVGTPTADDGHPAIPTATFYVCGYDNIVAFKAIRTTLDALLTVTYYKNK